MLLARNEKDDSESERDGVMKRPFSCAVFFSGDVPVAYDALICGEIREMELLTGWEIISIPTANIWGSQDALWPGRALALSEMCSSVRTVYIHDGGHHVPGSKSMAAVTGVVHAIRKTIDLALFASQKIFFCLYHHWTGKKCLRVIAFKLKDYGFGQLVRILPTISLPNFHF